MPVLRNRYCWLVTRTLEKPILIHSDNSKESKWDPDATDEMIKAIRHLKVPDECGQGTMGDLIDATDRQVISKVMLEERVFKTWYGGRTVLLGDGTLAANATILKDNGGYMVVCLSMALILFFIILFYWISYSVLQGNLSRSIKKDWRSPWDIDLTSWFHFVQH